MPSLPALNPRTCTALPIVIFAYSCQVGTWQLEAANYPKWGTENLRNRALGMLSPSQDP